MARHNDADKKHIEEEALRKIESEYQNSVGGYLQKLEVYPLEAGGAVSYTRDTRSNVLSDLPEAGPNLGYMPVGETRQIVRFLCLHPQCQLQLPSSSVIARAG